MNIVTILISKSPFQFVPPGNEDAVWLEPKLVCIVESMPTDKDSFRQPVFKGIRDDKLPHWNVYYEVDPV